MKKIFLMFLIVFISCDGGGAKKQMRRWKHMIAAERYLVQNYIKNNLIRSSTKYIRINIIKATYLKNRLNLTLIKLPIKHSIWSHPWDTTITIDINGGIWFLNNVSKKNNKYTQELININQRGELLVRKKVESMYPILYSLGYYIVLKWNNGISIKNLNGSKLKVSRIVNNATNYKIVSEGGFFWYILNNQIIVYQRFYADIKNRMKNDTNKYEIIELHTISKSNYSIQKDVNSYVITPSLAKKTFTNKMHNEYKELLSIKMSVLPRYPHITAEVDKFGNYYLQNQNNQDLVTDIHNPGEIDVFNRHGKKLFTFKYPKDYPFVIQTRTAVSKNGVIYILYYNEKGVFIDKFVPDYLYKKHNGDLSKCI